MEQAIDYFSILGGIGKNIQLSYDEDVFSMIETQFVEQFEQYKKNISPSYILEKPYSELLMAIARGDGKYYSALRKAKLNEIVGKKLIEELVSLNILKIEFSRESPLRRHPKHKLKKEERSYRVQDKLRFVQPFMRFWFGFVTYYKKDLFLAKGDVFLSNFENHYDRLRSLVFEQLCNDLLERYFKNKEQIISSGSYWNIYTEFDILAMTQSKKIILGECKYKDRTVCKNEFTKLKLKAVESDIKVDIYVIFSKSGFSKELSGMANEKLLLFDLNDLTQIL